MLTVEHFPNQDKTSDFFYGYITDSNFEQQNLIVINLERKDFKEFNLLKMCDKLNIPILEKIREVNLLKDKFKKYYVEYVGT